MDDGQEDQRGSGQVRSCKCKCESDVWKDQVLSDILSTLDLLHKRRRWLQLRPKGCLPPPPPPPRHRHRRQEVPLRLFQGEAPRHLHHRGPPLLLLILAALEVHRLK